MASVLATLRAHHPTALRKVGGVHHPSQAVTAATGKQVRSLPERGPNIMAL